MRTQLTKRQRSVLQFIAQFIRDRGYAPTLREIGKQFGIKSTNGVNDHLLALTRKGYLHPRDRGENDCQGAARGLCLTLKGKEEIYGQLRDGLKERIAEFLHEQVWSHTMIGVFTRAHQDDKGVYTFSDSTVDDWQKMMNCPYDDLPEPQKTFARDRAKNLMMIFERESRG